MSSPDTDVEDFGFTSSGLVRALAEAMHTGVPTHSDWAETLSCMLVGLMAGMERYISNAYGNLYANIFCIYIGASGLSFKTVPLKKLVRPLVKRLTALMNDRVCQRYGTTLDGFSLDWNTSKNAPASEKRTKIWQIEEARLKNIKRNLVDYMAPQRFTSEFLITWLKDYPDGVIVGDEYTKMFKGAKKKDYLTDNMEDLSRLYDCDMEKVGTQTRGVEYPENAFISFGSASTYYLLKLMDDDFFIQGTGNRILWIFDDIRDKIDVEKEMLEAKFFWGIDEKKQFDQLLDNLAARLVNIKELPEGVIPIEINASIMLDRYRLNMYNKAVELFTGDLLDKDANLIARLAQNAMKLSLIHCIGRYAWDFDRDDIPRQMEINSKDAQWAIDKIERHFNHYHRMKDTASRVRETTTRSYLVDIQRVRQIVMRLEQAGNKVTKTKIMQQTGWLKAPCQAILDAMIATKQLTMYTSISGTRKVTYYTLPKTGELS